MAKEARDMNELQTLIAEGETDLLNAAKAGWAFVETKLAGLEGEVQADLLALLKELGVDIENGDTAESLVTDLLNLAESQGKTLVLNIETNVLTGLVAALVAGL